MPEPTLSIAKDELEAQVGLYLGYGRGVKYGEKAWSAKQAGIIDQCVRSGLRQFYHPPLMPGERTAHDWSFLRPVATLTLEDGDSTVDLPDDYGSMDGSIALVGAPSSPLALIRLSSQVRLLAQASPDQTGAPLYADVESVKETTRLQGQRWRLRVWPTADQDYTLQMRYYLSGNALSGDRPFAYGGPQHAETVLASCLAVAEERIDNERGVMYARYMDRLAASISVDRRNKPGYFGYNGDWSDDPTGRLAQDPSSGFTATIGGSTPS